ncbi:putative DNA-binding domain-containing protein [Shewanella abyssi]|uniref:HvfC family RiPP maturation protein n=1 Tax=Shewanella abyssi TaxID=311789 RepID=UPI00200C2840|nr:putative DNA-binding domain-containing protein [Shewanella abyssi]MCL1048343.1 putative DNA-binding domain-containing protein [Shewanella abyssi]
MSFIDTQQNFMEYIKDPSKPLPEGIEARRMNIYRELFFNNIDGFVSNAFPVLKTLYSEQDWQQRVQQFFAIHDCQTPIFIEIAQEFLLFLQTEYTATEIDPPFMLELAHYEWLELVVAVAQENPKQRVLDMAAMDADVISTMTLSVSATSQIAQYTFDVQHISEDYRPQQPTVNPQFFCIYSDFEDEVSFLQLNPLTAQVLAYMSQFESVQCVDLIDWLLATFTDIEPAVLQQGCVELLLQLSAKGIIREFIA